MLKIMKMWKKLFKQEQSISNKRKARRKTIIRSLLLIAFLLIINTFAWFTYITKADLSINGSVVSWEVSFLDQNSIIKDVNIAITDMKPGMLQFSKTIDIVNNSDVAAKFTYKITSVEFLGTQIFQGEETDVIKQKLEQDFPFSLKIIPGKQELDLKDTSSFQVTMDWTYEEDKYFKVNSLYTYDSAINYYILANNTYQVDNTVTADNFASKVQTGLYLTKDDADSYFGYACGNYEANTKKPCMDVHVALEVSQLKT